MVHRPFSLHKRPATGKRGHIYYAQFYTEEGKRLSAKSTGQRTKSAAESWALNRLKQGLIPQTQHLSFATYAQDWWVWGKCPYLTRRLARGKPISPAYADARRSYLEQHILPFFGAVKLQKLTPALIESWLLSLRSESGRTGCPLSPTTVNHCLKTLKIMLKEAVRLGYLPSNPASLVAQLAETPKVRGILTFSEVNELFREDRIEALWAGDRKHFTLNLLAASTGLRMGEIQALSADCVQGQFIEVRQSWARAYGLKEPKWNSRRVVPLPSKTSEYLHWLIALSAPSNANSLIFSGSSPEIPIDNKKICDTFYKALERMGISEEERKRRNITFHSWRHFYNSLLRGRVPDSLIRMVTGHRTPQMTERYTHVQNEKLLEVLDVQEEYFGKKDVARPD